MTQYPAPPPPPPPPPGPPPAAPVAPPRRGRVDLDEAGSPYSILLALVVVLIFSAPNLLAVGLGALDAPTPTGALSTTETVITLVVSLVLQFVVFGLALLPLVVRRRLDGRLFGPSRPLFSGSALGWGVVAGIATVFIAYTVNAIVALTVGIDEPVEQQLLQDAMSGGAVLVVAVVIAVVVAPIVEEIIFRGVLYRAFAGRLGMWVGALVSAAVFAFIHVEIVVSQPLALSGLFVVGLVLAVAYHKTGNLLVPIVGHAVFNAFSLSLALVVDRLGLDELVAVVGLGIGG